MRKYSQGDLVRVIAVSCDPNYDSATSWERSKSLFLNRVLEIHEVIPDNQLDSYCYLLVIDNPDEGYEDSYFKEDELELVFTI